MQNCCYKSFILNMRLSSFVAPTCVGQDHGTLSWILKWDRIGCIWSETWFLQFAKLRDAFPPFNEISLFTLPPSSPLVLKKILLSPPYPENTKILTNVFFFQTTFSIQKAVHKIRMKLFLKHIIMTHKGIPHIV